MSKIYDKESINEGRKNAPATPEERLKLGKPVKRAYGGMMHTPAPGLSITFDVAENEKIITRGGAYIVFGSDRPSDLASGLGAQGATSATIDLVVGRCASARNGKGPRNGTVVQNNFAADAARIYISQLTNLDTNFGVQPGRLPQDSPRSGIGIKADRVNIIGREGVKIITGGMQGISGTGLKGELNSLGGKLESSPKIDLIAGNNVKQKKIVNTSFAVGEGSRWPFETIQYLQPVVKGDNLVKCFEDLSSILDDVNATIMNLSLAVIKALTAIAAAPVGPNGSPILAGPLVNPLTSAITRAASPTYTARLGKSAWERNFLTARSSLRITSENVSTT